MKRKTRFNDGGMNKNPFQGDDVDPFSAVRDEEGNIKKGEIPEAEPRQAVGLMEGLPTKPKSFKQAFSEAEDGSTFTWNGKSYKKEYAGSANTPALKDVPGSGRGKSAGRTAADVDTFTPSKSSGRAEIPTDTSTKAPASTGESTSGMSNMDKLMAGIPAGMGATRFLQAGARGLANVLRSREAMKQAAQAGAKQIGEGRKMLESPGRMKGRELAAERSERAARRDKEVARGIRQKADDSGAIRLAKGGSASSRADGCAARGKTRGKIY